MSGGWIFVGLSIVFGLHACAPRPASASSSDSAVFELGGDGPSLAQVLRAAADRSTDPATGNATPIVPLRVPEPERRVRFKTVHLPAGETLGELCARELGRASAWREVAELNGWSEADVRRLPTGCEVRLPIQ